jgi:hypothetical protein
VWGEGWSYCTTTCTSDFPGQDDCPAEQYGPSCENVMQGKGSCQIQCGLIDPCPEGMECRDGGLFGDFCAWPD